MTVGIESHQAHRSLRTVVIAGGIGASILFVVVGVASQLQMFGDGSIFSYAVAAQSAWAFHWHNISGRLFTYLFAYVPAKALVAMTQSAQAGIAVYGILFFAAPLLGLAATFAIDRTRDRTIFSYACLSTACLCPLVYGAPTEMWMAHAMFWPALALCPVAPMNWQGTAAIFTALLALVFTHEGAIVLAAAILFALLLWGWRDGRFLRAVGAFCAVLAVWAVVKMTVRPDDYIAGVLAAAAFRFIDIRNLAQPALLLLLVTLVGYGSSLALLWQLNRPHPVYAVIVCVALLVVYWVWIDSSLLAEARYNLRTLMLIMTPAFGVLASVHAMTGTERRDSLFPPLARWVSAIEGAVNPRMLAGAFLLIMFIHAVETSKFVLAWIDYKAAVRALATGAASDPDLGSPQFVSSHRIGAGLNRLAWNSTTPFLSVLVAPELEPTRLVVDPTAGYFWLSCQTARQSEATSSAIPAAARRLIRIHACLHR